jgi:hypothetical protein
MEELFSYMIRAGYKQGTKSVQLSSARDAVKRRSERGKLKNLDC